MKVTNRKEIEQLIYSVYDALDPTGINTDAYKTKFDAMNDDEFASFFKEFLENDNDNFCYELIDFENSIMMEHCWAAAKVLNIPLMEHIYFPHLTRDRNNVVVTKQKCLVGYFNVKRTQQMLHKKNGLAVKNEKISAITGQVVGDDKNARDSDIEATMLVAVGANRILQELHGPRADDFVMKRQMRESIATKGYVSLDELESSPTNKTTLNTINAYLLGMGLQSDLITDTNILPKTSDDMFS